MNHHTFKLIKFPSDRVRSPADPTDVPASTAPTDIAPKLAKRLRLKSEGWHAEGEVTLDGHHRYCRHQDVFWTLEDYERGHLEGTTIFVPSKEADDYLARQEAGLQPGQPPKKRGRPRKKVR